MVMQLSKLASLIEKDSAPFWLREEIEKKKDEIAALQENGQVVLRGPKGEVVRIRGKDK